MSTKAWYVLPGMKEVFFKYVFILEDYFSKMPAINNTPILIVGDSGVSKSLFIETAKQMFVKKRGIKLDSDGFSDKVKRLNCASFSKELAESEIFGHVKGAYTGATTNKAGIVEIANGGLLILDEIGELTEDVQAKLLIFIEDGEYRRLGSPDVRKASLKIIGTTNKQGGFRTDFWFRFYPIFLPALHERRLDVLYYIALKYPKIFKRLTPQHALSLLAHNWPGNTREIERVVSIMMAEDKLYDILNTQVNNENNRQLFFPLDQRQTSLVNMYLSDFCCDLIEAGFDVGLFNSIISAFGLQVPYSFSTVDELNKIKDVFKKSNFFQKLESPSKKQVQHVLEDYKHTKISFSGIHFYKNIETIPKEEKDYDFRELAKWLEPDSDPFTLHKLLSVLQDVLNSDGKFYSELTFDVVDMLKPYENSSGIYLVENNKTLENVGACFSAICNLFLRNRSVGSNVFDMHDIYDGEYWESSKTERLVMDSLNRFGIVEKALRFRMGKNAVIDGKYKIGERWGKYVKKVLNDNNMTGGQNLETPKEILCNDLTQYTEDQLLIEYYRLLLHKYRKDKDVFKHADVPNSTCRNRLIKLGLLPRNKHN